METLNRIHVGSRDNGLRTDFWDALNESADPLEGAIETCPVLVTDAEKSWLLTLPATHGIDWGIEHEPDAADIAEVERRRMIREHAGAVLAGDVPSSSYAAGVAFAKAEDPTTWELNDATAAAVSADLFMRGYQDARAVQLLRDSRHPAYVAANA